MCLVTEDLQGNIFVTSNMSAAAVEGAKKLGSKIVGEQTFLRKFSYVFLTRSASLQATSCTHCVIQMLACDCLASTVFSYLENCHFLHI